MLTLELSQYHISGSMVSSSEPVAAISYCSRLGSTLTLCFVPCPSKSQQLCGVTEFLFKSVTDAKFEPSKVSFLRLMPSTVLNGASLQI